MSPKKLHHSNILTMPEQISCSPAAWYSMNEYWPRDKRAEVSMRMNDALNAGSILHNFCAGRENPLLYDAAVLSEISSGIFKKESVDMQTTAEKDALRNYFWLQKMPDDNRDYICALLVNRIQIKDFWQKQTKDLYADNTEINQLLNRPLTDTTTINDKSVWDNPVHLVDVNKTFDLLERGVKLDSFLIRSAQNLAWIRGRSADVDNIDTSVRMLRKIAETESLLAPAMEVIGFHKMAMALNDICMRIRLYNSGNGWAVTAAQEFTEQLPSGEALNQTAGKIIKDLFGENYHEDVTRLSDPKMFMREGAIEPDTMLGEILRLILREKSIGSLARKLYEYHLLGIKGLPMDVLGATILAEDEEQIPQLFSRALLGVASDPNYQLHPSPSRQHAIHVQGSKEFCDRLPIGAIRKIAGSDWQPVSNKDFQVAKITFFYNGLPCEVQIITETGRVENNLGERTSHVIYHVKRSAKIRSLKNGGAIETGLDVDTTGWGEMLRQIHAGRDQVGQVVIDEHTKSLAGIFTNALRSSSLGMGRIADKLRNY
ncbi:MAG: hypothetical protein LBU20_02890 [Candidatus Nomurabacteria bacterium]|jgi:hypothetical protein|nr:hypothetical protein [Candidatus Nomurabacteria bacterium]